LESLCDNECAQQQILLLLDELIEEQEYDMIDPTLGPQDENIGAKTKLRAEMNVFSI
jgi:hypothetical protein